MTVLYKTSAVNSSDTKAVRKSSTVNRWYSSDWTFFL